MKLTLCLIVLLGALQITWTEQVGVYQHGAVVRMRMGDCVSSHRGFMSAMGGAPAQASPEACPEYTLVSEKVVYVIVGKSSNQLIPLADVIDFRLHGSELAVRVDDGKHEIKFSIREMILRTEWDMVQRHITQQLTAPAPAVDADLPLQPRNENLR
jgi:hypothetical protein